MLIFLLKLFFTTGITFNIFSVDCREINFEIFLIMVETEHWKTNEPTFSCLWALPSHLGTFFYFTTLSI